MTCVFVKNKNVFYFFVIFKLSEKTNSLQNTKTSPPGRSKDILGDMSQPRIFSLQKLVEVADFNMDSRGRIVWANVWGVLSQHFSTLGAHANRYVRAPLC